jgi:hypothetical protein
MIFLVQWSEDGPRWQRTSVADEETIDHEREIAAVAGHLEIRTR